MYEDCTFICRNRYMNYRVAGMIGRINVKRTTKLKVAGKKTFGEWINFGQKETNDELKFGWFKFGKPQTIWQIRQTIPLPNIPAIWCFIYCLSHVSNPFISQYDKLS